MKVLSIGSDRKMFDEKSSVALRALEYGKRMEELHIVVFSVASLGLKEKKLSENITLYPTNSSSRWFYVFDAIRIGKKIVADYKFTGGNSIITCQDPFESGFVGWRIAKKFHLPLHLQIHTDFLSPYFKNSFLQTIRVWIAKFLLPKATGVRVVSKRIADSIKKAKINLKNEPKILPVYIDIADLESKKTDKNLSEMFPQFKFIILMASRLTKEKRIPNALEVFAKVLKTFPQTGLVIAGDGPLKDELERKVLSLGIKNSVVFLGWREDVFHLMKSANMFLSVSAYEGYGMSVIEAGLAGCPILSTNVGVASDILIYKRNSYVCEVNDNICLYDGIMALIEDNGLRHSLAEFLSADIEPSLLSKEEYADKYVNLLEEAMKS